MTLWGLSPIDPSFGKLPPATARNATWTSTTPTRISRKTARRPPPRSNAPARLASRADAPRGVIHCFTGSPAFARQLLDRNFYISISGIVTFRAAENVRESARVVPFDRLLVETDSPFLAPVPMRGRPCEPAFAVHTARRLADLLELPEDQAFGLFDANARRVFLAPR